MTGRPPGDLSQPNGDPAAEPFQSTVRDWLAERGRTTAADARDVVATVTALPARPRPRRPALAAAASIALLVGVGALVVGRVLLPRISAEPPDPAAYAGDPRLDACRSQLGDVDRVFEMTHARWFPVHFPGWWKGAPELEVDDPALVVLERPRPGLRRVPGPSADGSAPVATPTPMFGMCIAVGRAGSATIHTYGQTWFERIVPVLSDADVARAAQMDPDVFADPATWPAPERLAPCGGLTADVQYVFEATPLRDFPRHFPSVAPLPVAAFDVDAPATIVVFRGRSGLAVPPIGVSRDQEATDPHDVCVIFSEPGPAGEAVLVRDVDLTGFRVRLEALPDPTPIPTPAPSVEVTPEPAPAWTADLAGQLRCDGPLANLGGEVPEATWPEALGDSADAALGAFLGPENPYASLPADGYARLHEDGRWASFGHVVDGRPKTIIVLTNTTEVAPDWTVVGLRACDPSEFDPAVPLTFPVTIWTDRAGNRVSTEEVRSYPGPGHCGWDSAIWLHLEGQLYFRDPNRVMAEWTTSRFDGDAQLPAAARDTGYRNGDRQLWLVPGGDAYLVSSQRVERWPRSTDPLVGCM